MPQELKTAFLEVNPDTFKLQNMFEKDRERMIYFKDLDEEQIKSITAQTLIINGDADVIIVEHAVELYRLMPHAQLAIIPGGHGKYIEEITTLHNGNGTISANPAIAIIREFLDKDVKEQ